MVQLKKIFILLCGIFILSGCSVEYNININDFEFTENVNIYADNEKEVKSLEFYLNEDIVAFSYDDRDFLYNTEAISGNKEGINLNFKYTDLAAYSLSSFFEQCYEKSNISTDEEKIYIKATNYICQGYNYNNVTSAVINLTTNHEVVSHNADKIDNGIYIWNLGNSGKDIDLELKLKTVEIKEEESEINKDEENNKANSDDKQAKKASWIITFLLLIGFIAALVLIIVFKSSKQR